MKSGTFMDSTVIYFLNRGVLMRTFIAFSWLIMSLAVLQV